jgi:hypothetical protein
MAVTAAASIMIGRNEYDDLAFAESRRVCCIWGR